jgi:CRISPR-associated protein Csx10
MKPFGGFYGVGEQKYYRARPVTRRISRTAINRQRAVAQDGLLYTLEVFDASRARHLLGLSGTLVVENGKHAELLDALKQIQHIGMAKSRGLGRVQVIAHEHTTSGASLAERLQQFNAAMQDELVFYREVAHAQAEDTDLFFTIDLLSDALLTDKGLPTTCLTSDALGLNLGQVTLERWWARHQVAGGWFAAANLPRCTELATAMGSVFLYRARGIARNELANALEQLEARGIGRERARGFGQIHICSPFHLEVA